MSDHSVESARTAPVAGACGSGTCDGTDRKTWCKAAGRCGETPPSNDELAQAWDEGHGTSNGGCVYWPDCAEIGDHVNPYRVTTPPGERT
jgi:hypothetical protein